MAALLATIKGHRIVEGRDGAVYCDCTAWHFSKALPKTCKHLDEYRSRPAHGVMGYGGIMGYVADGAVRAGDILDNGLCRLRVVNFLSVLPDQKTVRVNVEMLSGTYPYAHADIGRTPNDRTPGWTLEPLGYDRHGTPVREGDTIMANDGQTSVYVQVIRKSLQSDGCPDDTVRVDVRLTGPGEYPFETAYLSRVSSDCEAHTGWRRVFAGGEHIPTPASQVPAEPAAPDPHAFDWI